MSRHPRTSRARGASRTHGASRRAVVPAFVVGALLVTIAAPVPLPAQAHKELGRMWPLESVPFDFFQSEYGFRPTQEWLDHAQLAALRFGGGCSASFVSPRGLIMTNHHCARRNVASVSPEGQDWLGDGYFARSLDQEVALPQLTVQQLVSMRDVTAEINAGLGDLSNEERAQKLTANRKQVMETAQKGAPELRHQLVSLYQGGMYQVYSYKIYDDIRLVASPNLQSAKFGGDPDNFTYPRFGLDYAFARAYEDGKPADTSKHYLKWKTAGPSEGETVFVIGNPGSTGRLNTVAQMEFMRDYVYPQSVARSERSLKTMYEEAAADPERAKALRTRILGTENSRKANQGYLDGLRDQRVMDIKRKAEEQIRERIEADAELKAKYGDAWAALEEIVARKIAAAREGVGRNQMRALTQEERAAATRIGEAFFAVYGTEIPPDATFTLRISDGVVKTFPCNGTIAPWFTSLYGLYARHTEFRGEPPFDIPEIWLERREELDLSTPFNLVATCDIIGGNSGSPLINADAEVVGLVFDGNIEMLGNRFVFTDEVARTVCVHPAIIIESLRKVYKAPKIADELEGKGAGNK